MLDFSNGFGGSAGVLTYNCSARLNGTSAELTAIQAGTTLELVYLFSPSADFEAATSAQSRPFQVVKRALRLAETTTRQCRVLALRQWPSRFQWRLSDADWAQ